MTERQILELLKALLAGAVLADPADPSARYVDYDALRANIDAALAPRPVPHEDLLAAWARSIRDTLNKPNCLSSEKRAEFEALAVEYERRVAAREGFPPPAR